MADPLADGLCRSRPDLTWFGDTAAENRRAITVCRVCPVSKPCCEEADARREQWGVWGGVNRIAKTAVKREQRAVMETIWIRAGLAATNLEGFDFKADMAASRVVCPGTVEAWRSGCECDRCTTRFDTMTKRRMGALEGWA